MWRKDIVLLFRKLSCNMPGKTEDNHEDTSIGTDGNPVDIQEILQNETDPSGRVF
jgi:hypothetical protein